MLRPENNFFRVPIRFHLRQENHGGFEEYRLQPWGGKWILPDWPGILSPGFSPKALKN
jgi:hypothetical protein